MILNVGLGQTYTTIQAAINAAQAGDTVQIASGFSTNETTLTLRPSISVTGQAGPAVYLDGGVLQVDIGSGHFEVNGVTQAAGTTFAVTAAQLAQTTFVAGTTGDDLFVNVWDQAAFSGPKEFHIDIA